MSQLKKGALLSYGNIIATNAIGLLLTPFIIRSLGNSEYGLYTLIGSVIAYLSLMDLGIANTVVRYVSKYRAMRDTQAERGFLGSALIIYLLISVVLLAAGIVLYFQLPNLFSDSLDAGQIERARLMFAILVANLCLVLPSGMFTAICNAYERFVFPRMLQLARYFLRASVIFAVLYMGGKAVALVMIDTMMTIFSMGITMFFVFGKLKVRFSFRSFNRETVSGIFSYSVWVFILAIVSQFQWQGGQLMLGRISTPAEIAVYGVGIMLGTYYGTFSSAISGVFLPKATHMVVNESSPEEQTNMMVRIGRISLFALLGILGGFTLLGLDFVNLWVGPDYSRSWAIALVIMVIYTFPLVQSFANSLLEAHNKVYFKAITYFVLILAGTVMGYFLFDVWGLFGVVFGISVGWAISIVLLSLYYSRVLRLQMCRFYLELFPKMLGVFAVVLALGYLLRFIPINGWPGFLVKGALYFTLYLSLMVPFALKADERSLFGSFIPKKIKKWF